MERYPMHPPLFIPILTNLVHILSPYLKLNFIINSHLRLNLPRGICPASKLSCMPQVHVISVLHGLQNLMINSKAKL